MAAKSSRIGFYSGSFDPPTLGHQDVIQRSLRLVDELVIGIGVHPGKQALFTAAERTAMLEAELTGLPRRSGKRARVTTFSGLVVDAARSEGASVIIRGLRDGTDLDYEAQMAGMNGAMARDVETVFLISSPAVRHITATLVRQIAALGGDVTPFVTKAVAERLGEKLRATV